ncbi:helix-turn-helix domain-containing protein [Flavicella marina]|uniref:helix-turn-helix domain-containing protein n=1 Tax=Flavicella marina TaxID=1475951 RepID=UPI001264EBB0|nr:AraC family transcriptional regulator [Flavicella marina]
MKKKLQSLQLTLLNTAKVSLDKKWNYKNVISPFSRLYYITEGHAKVFHNDKIYNLQPNHMYLIPSFTPSNYQCDYYHEQIYISFFEELGEGMSIYDRNNFVYEMKASEYDLILFEQLLKINPQRALVNSNPQILKHSLSPSDFAKENNQISDADYIETKGILSILLSRFIRSKQIENKKNTNKKFNHILRYINIHLSENISVKHLADYCNLNPDYFSRIFNEKFGKRPLNYVNSIRIERAQFLLLSTQQSLKEISETTGFESISYFSKTFKKITGSTPAQFRRKNI